MKFPMFNMFTSNPSFPMEDLIYKYITLKRNMKCKTIVCKYYPIYLISILHIKTSPLTVFYIPFSRQPVAS